jgi:predicted HD phosphohydrolase
MNRNAITAAQKWVFNALLHDLNELCWILGHPVDDADTERLFSTNQAMLALLEYRRPSWTSLNR